MAEGLTPKQTAFVRHYIENGNNGTQAAISAGYSEKTASVMASENIRKPQISASIDEARAKLVEKHEINVEFLRDKFLEVYDTAMKGQQHYNNGVPSGAVIRQLTAAKGAMDSLGKLYGHMADKVDNTHRSIDNMSEAELKAELARGDQELSRIKGNVVKLKA